MFDVICLFEEAFIVEHFFCNKEKGVVDAVAKITQLFHKKAKPLL